MQGVYLWQPSISSRRAARGRPSQPCLFASKIAQIVSEPFPPPGTAHGLRTVETRSFAMILLGPPVLDLFPKGILRKALPNPLEATIWVISLKAILWESYIHERRYARGGE